MSTRRTATPFEGDPRYVLKRQLQRADAAGAGLPGRARSWSFSSSSRHANGDLLPLQPHDHAGYFDVSTDLAHSVRRQMVDALQAMGIDVEASHHEVADGQSEIDFHYGPALVTADNAITFRTTLKAIAQKNGLHCTFMPKPIAGISGSGMHVHQSLWDMRTGDTVMYDAESEYGLSDLALHFIAGQLAHAKAITPIIAPLVNSYKRLVPGYEAPVYISWGRTNRSALDSHPAHHAGPLQAAHAANCAAPTPACNPYLAFAVMLAAGLDGIEKKHDAARARRGRPLSCGRRARRAGHAARRPGPGDRGAASRMRSSRTRWASMSTSAMSKPRRRSGTNTGSM